MLLVVADASKALTLSCTYGKIDDVYGCEAEVADPEPVDKLTNVSGEHSEGDKDGVKRLSIISPEDFAVIPDNIHEHFPNLESIKITGSKLKNVSRKVIQKFSNLKSFVMSGNRITSLPHDLFADTRSVMSIDFSNNLISEVGVGLLRPLLNLREANFEQNRCIDVKAGTDYESSISILELKLAINCSPETLDAITRSSALKILGLDTIEDRVETLEFDVFDLKQIVRRLQEWIEGEEDPYASNSTNSQR